VFIFSRMGDNKRALTLIIDNLDDVKMAIDFVRGVGDEDLWNDLVEQAKAKPRIVNINAANHRIHQGLAGACGRDTRSNKVG
jgi:hypothetical protein